MLSDKMIFDHRILISTEFAINTVDTCKICQSVHAKDSAPFFYSDVPTSKLIALMKEEYQMDVTKEDVEEHTNHIRPIYDTELQAKAEEEARIIESDIIKIVKSEDVIESTIKGLYARRLHLEKLRNYDKEWILVCQTLNKWVELKLKKEKKIDSATPLNISFGDLIKAEPIAEPVGDEQNDGDTAIFKGATATISQ